MSSAYSQRVASRVLLACDNQVAIRLLYAFSIAIFVFAVLFLTGLIDFKSQTSHTKILNVSLVAEPINKPEPVKPVKAVKAIAKYNASGKVALAPGDVSAQVGIAMKKSLLLSQSLIEQIKLLL
ncbi:hypothetical protein [Piscirickettsia litoralis]|uniref:Uncharacterized protein n=1 Tax=Piscirickettsia litoralis TaxID=1891921 RepID=A0ABX3AAD9_9GAMM|nr:hypothetical protein [Piscirickettsia litoralis]ODN43094.1 hypothetical protein BGC07_09415 [Piscirickettsia litoralis]